MVASAARVLFDRINWYSRIAAGRARFTARAALGSVAATLVTPEVLLLDCPDGDEASGLFSEAAAVVGALAHVEHWPTLYAGLRVDFREHGLYYDSAAGPNWWEYYFEPVAIGTSGHARTVADWEHDAFAHAVELRMQRVEAARLVKRYVVPKASIGQKVDAFWREHVGDVFTVGVHYRGTDKWEGAPVVPFDAMAAAVTEATSGRPEWKVVVATDEQPFLD
ncbi:MAG TPA: hypothetical protein VNT81_17540, partial [Vicinamibacterales bacterium]|nr:hypothetical protein [Vicinamibacterales bacterium]